MANFELVDDHDSKTRAMIKVIGVGGGGCNAVNQMMDFDLEGVEMICANTDMQVLSRSPIGQKLQLGVKTTRGLGAGSKPEVGRAAAEEDRDRIKEMLTGADMLFIAAGMGGGTGTGAAPVIANIARERDILTVAVVTKPFSFEGSKRMRLAEAGLRDLKKEVNCLIVIPNDRISDVMGDDATLEESFKVVDSILKNNVYSIAQLIQGEGIINIDIEDVRTAMGKRGVAIMGTGIANGENRARAAAEKAVSSPLLENIDLAGARGLLVNVTSSRNLKKSEFTLIGDTINEMIEGEVDAKIGWMLDDEMGDNVRVTVIATGIRSDLDDEEELVAAEELDAPGQPSGKKGDEYVDIFGSRGDIPAFLRRKSR